MTQDCESLTMMCARHLAGGWALGGGNVPLVLEMYEQKKDTDHPE